MSGLIGIWNLDGQPIDPWLVRMMTDAIAHRGPDGSGHWTDQSVALGHRMLYTTAESLRETQPLADETNTLCLALDGRVDNREEIKAALAARGVTLRTDTDAELVLKAYECWGGDCPKHILGDFAFVIWDGWNQRLFCARDPMGSKPFYYYMDAHVFLCASELQPILAHPAVERKCNDGMVGEYLANAIISQEETLYRAIFRLPPAHSLLVRSGRLWKERYWGIDPTKTVVYKTDREYADHFRELFQESVRCRLRSHGPVGSYLSGGLDSSSVVGMAQHVYRQGASADFGFETFSLIFPGWGCDESAYIHDVGQMWGVPSHTVRPPLQDRAYFADCAQQSQDFPGYPNGTMGNSLRVAARARGIRVLLTGGGGDEWLTGSLQHAADLLRKFRMRSMLHRIGSDSGLSRLLDLTHAALAFGLQPLMPPTWQRAIRRMRGRDGIPPWIDESFARRISLADRLAVAPPPLRFPTYAQMDICSTLSSGWWPHHSEIEERAASRFGIEERHPLTDRRIVEFALAIPETQRWRGTRTKFVLREAMRGLLPETVRERQTKAEFSSVFLQAFQTLDGLRFFEGLDIASIGWVKEQRVCSMYREAADPRADRSDSFPNSWPLWMIVGIELWLNHGVLAPQARLGYHTALRERPAHTC